MLNMPARPYKQLRWLKAGKMIVKEALITIGDTQLSIRSLDYPTTA